MGNDSPLVSVVMSTYNEDLKYVTESIDSILNQTYKKIELIVVLDNPDNSGIRELLKRYSELDNRVKILINNNNLGLPASLNRGIKKAKGEIICRMDADDISHRERLEKSLLFFKNNKLDFISTNGYQIDEDSNVIKQMKIVPSTHKKIEKKLKHGNYLIHPSFMFYKTVFNEVEGYNEYLKFAQDYDFVLKVFKRGFKVGTLNQPLIRYRIRANGISQSKKHVQLFLSLYISEVHRKGTELNKEYIKGAIEGTNREFTKFNCAMEKYYEYKYYIKTVKIGKSLSSLWKAFSTSAYFTRYIYDAVLIRCIK